MHVQCAIPARPAFQHEHFANLSCFCSRWGIVPTLARRRLNQNRDADLMSREEETATAA